MIQEKFQHTAARRRLAVVGSQYRPPKEAFQHTAARRRLEEKKPDTFFYPHVSTHSRPKAAGPLLHQLTQNRKFQHTAARRRLGFAIGCFNQFICGFNTQPPEGGWSLSQKPCSIRLRSPDFAKLSRKA